MTVKKRSWARRAGVVVAMAAALSFGVGDAFARAGGGKSSGSRGSMSRSAPPVTDTAPRTAQPLPGATNPSAAARAPGAAAAASAAAPSRFGGLMGGLAMGFLGAGLFGLLTGNGFLSGLGSMMGFIGLLLQVALVFFIVRFALNWYRNRNQPAGAAAGAGMERQATPPEWTPGATGAGTGAAAMAAAAAPVITPLKLIDADFNTFERLLGEIQTCYSNGDRMGLSHRATPEMCRVFGQDLDEADRAGVANRIRNVKLLQGDLSEAWREGATEYATVAMRFQLNDVTVNKATGQIVDGEPDRLVEATEVWTFVRRAAESPEAWRLSAIQQA